MTFALWSGALASERPVIRAADAEHLADGIALLEATERAADASRAAIAAERDAARRSGIDEGIARVHATMATRLAAMADDLAAQQQARDEQLSAAALAAVEAILGAAGAEAIGPALVRQAIAGLTDDEPVQLTVAPALAAQLRRELADNPRVRLVEDPGAGPLDCELRTARGTVRAGLDVQLAALAERWEAAT